MNGHKTYLKRHNENTAICACTNVIKTCHGHVLNVCFSATLWTFHFETAAKRAARYCDGCPERSSASPWKPTRITCTSSSRAGQAHLRLVTAGLDKPPQHTRWGDMSPEESTLTLDLHLFQKAAFDWPAPAHEHGMEDSHWKAQAPISRGARSTNPRHRDKSAP